MNLYISDTHFGHKNVISLDGRPFASVQEMDCAIIERWNEKVRDTDDIYILGDFCYMSERPEQWYLRQLKGNKHLIIGNHDRGLLRDKEAMTFFESAEKMQYVIDGNNRIILCHYPICEWNGFHNGVWHIYGHIHGKRDDTYLFMKQRKKALNAGCMINNYVPVTLSELIENNEVFNRQKGDLNVKMSNDNDFLSDEEELTRFKKAVEIEKAKNFAKGLPVVRYDLKHKKTYFEFPDGTIKYKLEEEKK